jgi:hypothetical protein
MERSNYGIDALSMLDYLVEAKPLAPKATGTPAGAGRLYSRSRTISAGETYSTARPLLNKIFNAAPWRFCPMP